MLLSCRDAPTRPAGPIFAPSLHEQTRKRPKIRRDEEWRRRKAKDALP